MRTKKEYEVLGNDGKTILKQAKFRKTQVGYIVNQIEKFSNKNMTHQETELVHFLLMHDNPQWAESWKEGTCTHNSLMNAIKDLIKINNSPELINERNELNALLERIRSK